MNTTLLEKEILKIKGSLPAVEERKQERFDKYHHIFDMFSGMDGQGGMTLQATGNKMSISRERVRQVVEDVKDELLTVGTSIDGLMTIIEAAEDLMPMNALRLEKSLADDGLIPASFSIKGLLKVVSMLGTKSQQKQAKAVCFVGGGDRSLAFLTSQVKAVKRIQMTAKKEVASMGLCSLHRLGMVKAILYYNYSKDKLKDIVSSNSKTSEVIWVDEDWFSYGRDTKNKVIRQVDKMFRFYEEIKIETLIEALERGLKLHKSGSVVTRIPYTSKEISGFLTKIDNGDIKMIISEQGEPLLRREKSFTEGFQLSSGEVEEGIAKYVSDSEEVSCQEIAGALNYLEPGPERYLYSVSLTYSSLLVRTSRGQYNTSGLKIRKKLEKTTGEVSVTI